MTVEVVNTSITAINSITLKDYINQVLKFDPDAILIYAGHNEFYGAFGVGSKETMSRNPVLLWMHFKLINLRTYQLIRSALGGISKHLLKNSDGQEEQGTLMKRIVGDENIAFQGEEYQLWMEQYKKNLSYILKKTTKNNVPVFFSDLVSNIKDLPPFGNVGSANQSADQTYGEAVAALAEGDTLEAKSLFYRAKDLDPIRFRASEEINDIIHDLAEQYKATLIPTKDWFENVSEGGLIGNKLLTEHVHPNIEGQFVLADAFYTSIVSSGVIDAEPDPTTSRDKDFYRDNWTYTDLDSLIKLNDLNAAEEYLRESIVYGGNLFAYSLLGEVEAIKNNYKGTMNLYNDCPLVNFRIGNILYQQQDLAALPFYDKASEGFAMDPDFLVRYCVANIFNQNKSKAKEIFLELSEIAPQHSNLPNLKKALDL